MSINRKLKTVFIVLLSAAFGFSMACILSIPANKLYTKGIEAALFTKHKRMGVYSLKDGDIDDALFHFRSAIYFDSEENKNLFRKLSGEWVFSSPVLGAIGNYTLNLIYDLDKVPEHLFTTTAMYGYALEKSGAFEAAEQEYTEVINNSFFESIDQIKKYVEDVLNDLENEEKLRGAENSE